MIDVVIINSTNNTLQQTLSSIALQTKIKLGTIYIWSKDDNCNIISSLFSLKLKISLNILDEIDEKKVLNEYSQIKQKGDFVIFIRGKDLFYNCFSLYNLYNSLSKSDYDIANGNIIKGTQENYFCSTNTQTGLFGRLYNINFVNRIPKKTEISTINELILSQNPKIIFLKDNIYIYKC